MEEKVKISRNCLEGYLTVDCPKCCWWSDGSDGQDVGCNSSVPISWCKSFKRVLEEDSGNDKIRSIEA